MHTIVEVTKQSFEVGTVVMLTKRGQDNDPNGMGPDSPWMNVWMDEMDFYIGRTLVVDETPEGFFHSDGVFMKGCPFAFPSNVLVALSA